MSGFQSRRLRWLCGLLVMAGVAAAFAWWQQPRRPAFLLITLDTTRADRLGSYGHRAARTPALDALAESGVRFAGAYATAPLTLPSHATMLTGLYPPEHGLRTNGKGRLHSEIPTLATTLQQAGYRTGAFVGAFVLDSKFGLDQGFGEYDDDLSESRRTDDPLHRERPAHTVVDRALQWLGQDVRQPFFCWVHLYDPHYPYQEHADEFGDEFADRPYDAELAFVDRQVQRLTEFLNSNGIADETLVMVVGDHGEGLGDHQELMHGYMLYNSTLHVPWLASWPGHIPSNSVVDTPVSLVDLLPTGLDWLQIQAPAGTTGRSLKALVDGESIEPSPCYAETDDPRLDNGWCGLQTILTPEWKYIRTADPELFRSSEDADERHDLADAEPGQVKAMDRQLLDFLAGLTPRKTDLANLSSRELRVLAGLGYTAGRASAEPSPGDLRGPDIKVMAPHFNRVVEATHLLESGDPARAEPLLRATVAAVPDYAIAWETLGRCLARQTRFDESRACFERMLDLDAEDTRALLHLAAADLAERRLDPAADRLRRVLEIDPESAEAWYYLAGARLQAGKPDEAQSHFRRALACDPEHLGALQGLGDFHFERQEFDRAIEYYTAVNRLDPFAPGPFVNRGIALGQLGDLDAAVRCFNDGLAHLPADPLLHSNLGLALQQLRRYGDAIGHYEQALSAVADEPLALVNLSLLLSAAPDPKLRDGQRALQLAGRAVEVRERSSAEALVSLAAANAELGRFDEAVAGVESALRSPYLSGEQQSLLQRQATLYSSRSPYRLPP